MTSIARVLVVDDNALSRRKMAMAAKRLGHDPVEAESGEMAFATLGAQSIYLMLLDIVMDEAPRDDDTSETYGKEAAAA